VTARPKSRLRRALLPILALVAVAGLGACVAYPDPPYRSGCHGRNDRYRHDQRDDQPGWNGGQSR